MSELHRAGIVDELFLTTNLFPATTGLPMVVWVGPGYGASHDVRIEVMQAHGTRVDPGNLAVVALPPQPHVVVGRLSASDLTAVTQWIALNKKAILDHWSGLTDGVQLARQLRRLPAPGTAARPEGVGVFLELSAPQQRRCAAFASGMRPADADKSS